MNGNSKNNFDGINILKVYKSKKDGISFFNTTKTFTDNNYRNIKENDVIVIKNNRIIDNYLYDDASHYFSKKNTFNYALEINKFGNICNLNSPSTKNCYREILNNIKMNTNEIKLSLKSSGYVIKSFSAEVANKIVVGLGGVSVYENDITLHHTYGVPYIPGQAIKGILRNYIVNKYVPNISELDERQIDEIIKKEYPLFSEIFGSGNSRYEENQGKIIFFDSYPDGNIKIDVDVMTPHHKEYYGTDSEKLPYDDDVVSPIKFLVVDNEVENRKLKFIFNIAINKNYDFSTYEKKEKSKIEDIVLNNLKEALFYIGVGAKTALGYGHFINSKELE